MINFYKIAGFSLDTESVEIFERDVFFCLQHEYLDVNLNTGEFRNFIEISLSRILGLSSFVYLIMASIIDFTKYFEINPEIRFGRPVIKGTRITVYNVLGWLASGQTHEEILEDFPQLNNDQILACLSYANY